MVAAIVLKQYFFSQVSQGDSTDNSGNHDTSHGPNLHLRSTCFNGRDFVMGADILTELYQKCLRDE